MKRRNSTDMSENQAQKKLHLGTITLVTGNQGKLREITRIIKEDASFTHSIVSRDIDLPELQGTPEEISIGKLKTALEQVDGPCFIEDVCLCYNALGGMPGPYIKWFMKGCGLEGLNKILDSFPDKSAYALCVLGFSEGKGHPIKVFTGRVDGTIVAPRGTQGFGWDPIFQPNESNGKTFAEMNDSEKDSISHRRRAVEALRDYLKTLA